MTLRTEAELLKAWMAEREAVAQRRREGPLQALQHRHQLLQRDVSRLELEVVRLEKLLARPAPGGGRAWVLGLLRGGLLALAATAWMVGLATLTPEAQVHDASRVAAVVASVVLVVLIRLHQESKS